VIMPASASIARTNLRSRVCSMTSVPGCFFRSVIQDLA
jgi:hypothetical protein